MKTCLVVDDSKVIRKVARHILETLDFTVREAGSGMVEVHYRSEREGLAPFVVGLLKGLGAAEPDAATVHKHMHTPICTHRQVRPSHGIFKGKQYSGRLCPPVVAGCKTGRRNAQVAAARH